MIKQLNQQAKKTYLVLTCANNSEEAPKLNEKIVPMLNRFKAFIEKETLLQSNDRLLLALSGGVDSMVLAHLLLSAKIPFAVAHVNFGLRGAESDADQAFVENWAKEFEVTCFVKPLDAKKRATEKSISTQLAARELRYEWFNHLIQAHHFSKLAIAHHADDTLETTLYNLTKGSGIKGIRGILPKTDHLIRPLLFASRADIERYAQLHQIQWREDRSNASDQYSRNFLRHKVVPLLKQINPALSEQFPHTHKRLQAADYFMKQGLQRFKASAVHRIEDRIHINIDQLNTQAFNEVVLADILSEVGFSYVQSLDIIDGLASDLNSGKRFYSGSHLLVIDRKEIIVSPLLDLNEWEMVIEPSTSEVSVLNQQLKIEWLDAADYPMDRSPLIAALDADTLQFPLKIRKWKAGDHFVPLGMKGKKNISDFMIDAKIPLNLKERVLVLEQNDRIVWLLGHRIDDRHKITSKTQRLVVFSLL